MRERRGIFQGVDWVMIIIYLLLVFMGWINIYAAVYNQDHASIFDLSQRYGKQLMWIAASLLLAFVIILIDPKFFNQFAFLIYGIALLTLLFVLGFGKEVAGSKSWFQIGSFAIQPAEFVKFSTALALAHYLGNLGVKVDNLKATFYSAVIILTPAALILLQNDTGSALVYVSFILVLYRQGLSGNIFIIGFVFVLLAILSLLLASIQAKLIMLGIILLFMGVAYFFMKHNVRNILKLTGIFLVITAYVFSVDFAFNKLQKHQQVRIKVLLNIESDPHGAGYNVNQSKIAIGSGGLTGKGFLKGTQTKFNFVPEQSTDFIFCTVGEEWGFLGTSTVIILFVILLMRIVYVAERQRSHFSKIYGYGVASILFFHLTINVGMVLGLLPVIGIPLPFFSYGGSSLWAFTILLFIFIRQDAERMQLL
ncbi:MAG: rod shape-determining protein RodA [Bacteroidetes bacterium]|nr:MAG: rod shape-determining protein RodA [Bacteroidota bacterium]